eukprot:scaffold3079_cov62-Phaeocystis_antarctica.AAC.2
MPAALTKVPPVYVCVGVCLRGGEGGWKWRRQAAAMRDCGGPRRHAPTSCTPHRHPDAQVVRLGDGRQHLHAAAAAPPRNEDRDLERRTPPIGQGDKRRVHLLDRQRHALAIVLLHQQQQRRGDGQQLRVLKMRIGARRRALSRLSRGSSREAEILPAAGRAPHLSHELPRAWPALPTHNAVDRAPGQQLLAIDREARRPATAPRRCGGPRHRYTYLVWARVPVEQEPGVVDGRCLEALKGQRVTAPAPPLRTDPPAEPFPQRDHAGLASHTNARGRRSRVVPRSRGPGEHARTPPPLDLRDPRRQLAPQRDGLHLRRLRLCGAC